MALGRRHRRGSLFGWVSDVLDATHDYADDWTDRFDDFEDEARDAVDDLVEDRYHYEESPRGARRYYYEGPAEREELVSEGRRERAASPPVGAQELDHLRDKITSLTKQVEALLHQSPGENTPRQQVSEPVAAKANTASSNQRARPARTRSIRPASKKRQ